MKSEVESRMNEVIHLLKRAIFIIGVLGVVVIYSGFLYLTFTGRAIVNLSWFSLLSPWICIYFGSSTKQQAEVRTWFLKKFRR